jgi:hypothetical protein
MNRRLKILLILFIIGLIAAVLGGVLYYNKPHADYEKMKPDFSLSSSDLYQAYKANTSSAEKMYNGKVVEISGNMTKSESNDTMVTAIFVFSQGMFGDEGIRCTMLPSCFDIIRKMAPESPCKIKGFCTGYNDTDVILDQCSIVR